MNFDTWNRRENCFLTEYSPSSIVDEDIVFAQELVGFNSLRGFRHHLSSRTPVQFQVLASRRQ